jgi:DNA-binding MarR family transcriptional regulator
MRRLDILQAIGENEKVPKRDLLHRVSIATRLADRYLRQLVDKGLLKVKTAPRRRVLYWLTPKGLAEKTRLTCEFVSYTYKMYRECHRLASNTLHDLARRDGVRRVVFYGAEPLAEIVAVSLPENELELVAVADEDAIGRACAGHTVQSIDALDELAFDAILFTKFSKRDDPILRRLLETKGRVVDVTEPPRTDASAPELEEAEP